MANGSSIPRSVREAFGNPVFERRNLRSARAALRLLGAHSGSEFSAFFSLFIGGCDANGWLLLDVCEGHPTIVDQSTHAWQSFGWPTRLVVLTELQAHSVLVHDLVSGQVYLVDFEGGDEALVRGELAPDWPSWFAFLQDVVRP